MDRRFLSLGLLALLAAAWVAWQIYAGWGLVTLDARITQEAHLEGL